MDQSHASVIQQVGGQLADYARRGYKAAGRGLVLLEQRPASGGMVEVELSYVAAGSVGFDALVPLVSPTAVEAVGQYLPDREMVIGVKASDRKVATYLLTLNANRGV